MKIKLFMTFLSLVFCQITWSQQAFYVSPQGSDTHDGLSAQTPFKTIVKARDAVRAVTGSMTSDITVYLMGGNYYIDQPIEMDERDSGKSASAKVIYKAYQNEKPIIFGGKEVAGPWTQHAPNVYKTNIGSLTTRDFRTLQENDDTGFLCRSAPYGEYHIAGNQYEQHYAVRHISWKDGDLPNDFSSDTAFLTAWSGYFFYNWFRVDFNIKEIKTAEKKIYFESTDPNASGSIMDIVQAGARYFLQNDLSFVDEPGEFYLDVTTRDLYYYPRNLPIDAQTIVVPTVTEIFKLAGTDHTSRIKYIDFEGLEFVLADLVPNAVNRDREAQLRIDNAEQISIKFCKFKNAGLHAVGFNYYAQSNTVYGNWFEDIGHTAVNMHGWDHKENGPFSTPDEAYVNKFNTISNNRMYNIGMNIPMGLGIMLRMSGDNTVTHNDIGHGPRWGISLKGWRLNGMPSPQYGLNVTSNNFHQLNYSRNNYIAYNNLYDLVRDSQDSGCIEGWGAGRDNIVKANMLHDFHDRLHEYFNTVYLDAIKADGTPVNEEWVIPHNQGIFAMHNDDDFDYTTLEDNIIYNWQGSFPYKNNGNLNNIEVNQFIAANEMEAEFIATGNDVDFDSVGLLPDFPWPIPPTTYNTTPLLQYPFDETTGTAVADAQGNNNGTVQGTASWNPAGYAGGAFELDGSSYIDIPASVLDTIEDEVTFVFRVNDLGNGYTNENDIIEGKSANDLVYHLGLASTNELVSLQPVTSKPVVVGAPVQGVTTKLSWTAGRGLDPYTLTNAVDTVQDRVGHGKLEANTWHHIAVTKNRDTGRMMIYIDGRVYAFNYHIPRLRRPLIPVTSLTFGKGFAGLVDDFRIYDKELTATEIKSLSDSTSIHATFDADVISGDMPLEVTFNAFFSHPSAGASITSYAWDVTNDSVADYTGTNAAVRHTFTQKGVYPIELTLTDDSGQTDTAMTTITVLDPDERSHAIMTNDVFEGGTPLMVNFYATNSLPTSGETIVEYAWDFDRDGIVDSTAPTGSFSFVSTNIPSASVSGVTYYYPQLTVIDSAGSTNATTSLIKVYGLPYVTISTPSDGERISPGASITLIGDGFSSTGATLDGVWSSDIDGILNGGLPAGSFTWTPSEGTHTVTLSVTDALGQVGTKQITLNVATASIPMDYVFRVDANDVDGDGTPEGVSEANVDGVDNLVYRWVDTGSRGSDAVQTDSNLRPKLLPNALNGKSTLQFDGVNDFMKFDEIDDIRTVFWVLKDSDVNLATTARNLLGHYDSYHFSRGGSDTLWHGTFTHAYIRNGTTRLNGMPITGLVNGQNLDADVWSTVSLVTTGPVEATQITRDRGLADRNWKGEIAEILIYNYALSSVQVTDVEAYLNNKWFSPPDTFAAWATGEGLSGDSNADSDQDGVTDFVEYALGMDPTINDASLKGSFAVQANGDVLYRFAKPISAVSYTVQYTSDLTTPWKDFTGDMYNGGTEMWVTIPGMEAQNGHLYIRLKLEQ